MDMRKYQSATAWALFALTSATAANAQPQGHFAFDLPAQTLSQALRDVAVRTGRNVIAPADLLGGQQAAPLSGTFTVEEAISRLLAGSGLRYRLVEGTLVVERSPFVEEAVAPENAEPAASTITVTGTRIRGAGSASPVTVTTRRELEQAGINDLADFTRILPQNYTGGQNRGIAGGGEQGGQQNLNDSAALNLRGLGPDATLTLLNGHRLSYDALDQGVDISAIPLGAIERIEVVADGASALYGSDAVAGVANVILRRDYEGLETTARIGGSTDGGNFQQEYSAVGGRRWSSGGFMVALDHSRATPIDAGQRDYTRTVDPSLFLTDRIKQTSGVLSAHQQIAPGLSLDLDGIAMNRRSLSQNPFFPATDVHVSGIVSHGHVRTWALTPTLRADLGAWQAMNFDGGGSTTMVIDGLVANKPSDPTGEREVGNALLAGSLERDRSQEPNFSRREQLLQWRRDKRRFALRRSPKGDRGDRRRSVVRASRRGCAPCDWRRLERDLASRQSGGESWRAKHHHRQFHRKAQCPIRLWRIVASLRSPRACGSTDRPADG